MSIDVATPRAPLLPVAVACAAGIAWDAVLGCNTSVVLAIGVVALVSWWRWGGRPVGLTRPTARVSLLALLLLAWSVGALRHRTAVSHVASDDLVRLVTPGRQLVRLEATLTATPRVRMATTVGGIRKPRTVSSSGT